MSNRASGEVRDGGQRAWPAVTEEAGGTAERVIGPACAKLVAELRDGRPEDFASGPLPPGQAGPPVTLATEQVSALYLTAFAAVAGASPPPTGAPPGPVVWSDGEHELLVQPAAVRILFQEGFVLVGIPVYTEQTGPAEISVPFAVGSASQPAGLMIATETVPRGPALLVERWGDQLIAAAWRALVHMVSGVAAAAGSDTGGGLLIAAALAAEPDGLTVLPQAAQAFDRPVS